MKRTRFIMSLMAVVFLVALAPSRARAAYPGLLFSSFLGGGAEDILLAVTVDSQSNLYVAGYTRSSDFPNNPCTLDCVLSAGTADAFVAKLDPTGTQILFVTLLGGDGDDFANGIALDAAGNIYVAGQTSSTDFPTVLPNQTNQTGIDGFLSKLSPDGTTLLYSTYLGGSNLDLARGLAVDATGNAYVTGWTNSGANFPVLSAVQAAFQGGAVDGFALKFDTSGALVYGTYLGGTLDDYGIGVTVDGSGNAFLVGQSNSVNYPTLNPFQTPQGDFDAVVVELSPAGALLYGTYFGGAGVDSGVGVVMTAANTPTFVGYTESANLPLVGSLQGSNGSPDVLLATLPNDGSPPTFSTYLGGTGYELASQLVRGTDGRLYVAGFTDSTDLPGVGPDSVASALTGPLDGFLTIVDTAPAIAYATYLGGEGNDAAYTLAVDAGGFVYLGGQTDSLLYPTRAAFDTDYNGGVGDAFFAKLDLVPPQAIEFFPANFATGVPVGAVLFVRFDKDMDPANFDANSVQVTDGVNPVTGTWSYDVGTRRYFFQPDAPLLNDTLYTATLTTAPTDWAQNPVATEAWSFTTEPAAPATTGGTTTGSTTGDETTGGGITEEGSEDNGGEGSGGGGGTATGATPALPLTYVLGGPSCALVRGDR